MLPNDFRPAGGVPLCRLGRDNDGGYLVDRRNLDHADLLIGMGICDDWSFEEDFLAARQVSLLAYDGSVSARDLFIEFYTRVALFEPINAKNALRQFLAFRKFFNQKGRRFSREFINRDAGTRNVSLNTVLARDIAPGFASIFLKIDIEGSEYESLGTILAMADRIEGMVIEFHDIDRNIKAIRSFLSAFPLALVHVHGNNFAPVLDDGTPLVIECSFTRQPVEPVCATDLPHPLDMPCDPGAGDLAIAFAGGSSAGKL